MSFIPAGRREVNVRGDGKCFYSAMALAVGGNPTILMQCFEPCVMK